MTTFFLVRHARHVLGQGILVGRTAGVALDGEGNRQAAALAERFAEKGVTAVQTSPRRRARETAAPIAMRLRLRVEIVSAIDEIEVGAWAGRSFAALEADPLWKLWNTARETVRPPDGEGIAEVQARVLGHIAQMAAVAPAARIVAVSHAEPIRAAALKALGLPPGAFHRIEIGPASITTIVSDGRTLQVVGLNEAVT